jgi:hypothetical protein
MGIIPRARGCPFPFPARCFSPPPFLSVSSARFLSTFTRFLSLSLARSCESSGAAGAWRVWFDLETCDCERGRCRDPLLQLRGGAWQPTGEHGRASHSLSGIHRDGCSACGKPCTQQLRGGTRGSGVMLMPTCLRSWRPHLPSSPPTAKRLREEALAASQFCVGVGASRHTKSYTTRVSECLPAYSALGNVVTVAYSDGRSILTGKARSESFTKENKKEIILQLRKETCSGRVRAAVAPSTPAWIDRVHV